MMTAKRSQRNRKGRQKLKTTKSRKRQELAQRKKLQPAVRTLPTQLASLKKLRRRRKAMIQKVLKQSQLPLEPMAQLPKNSHEMSIMQKKMVA